jgi:hypothetical protein
LFPLEKNWQFEVPDFGVWSVVDLEFASRICYRVRFCPSEFATVFFFFFGFSVNSLLSQQGFGFATIFCHFLEGFFFMAGLMHGLRIGALEQASFVSLELGTKKNPRYMAKRMHVLYSKCY